MQTNDQGFAAGWFVATSFERLENKLDSVIRKLNRVLHTEETIMSDLTQLTADVAADTTVDQSAITLLQGLKAALDAAGTDPAKLAELSAQLEQNTADLSAAVTANTPAA